MTNPKLTEALNLINTLVDLIDDLQVPAGTLAADYEDGLSEARVFLEANGDYL